MIKNKKIRNNKILIRRKQKEKLLRYLSNYFEKEQIEVYKERINKVMMVNDTECIIDINTEPDITDVFLLEKYKTLEYFPVSEEIKPTFAVNSDIEKYTLKGLMFKQLVKAAATDVDYISEEEIYVKTGIEEFKKNITREQFSIGLKKINDALTLLVTKFIYDETHSEKMWLLYNIEESLDDMLAIEYGNEYFLLAFLLLNYFEENPKELLEIYFNNNAALFEKILKEKFYINFELLTYYLGRATVENNEMTIFCYEKIKELNNIEPINNMDVLYQMNMLLQ